ncbi:4-hydroxy-tetrahydrodipicolinate reductase [Lentibacillus sp. JNUCC-1]|uniref:4-hydroxy-tetrahydrodipicolinate reductase n=1 Tax=Lentibacillus sp. JNUCC-1 TaxID=2654513 RepID=UPI0012E73461|nr:4-hydroxy-tetrahydrodipicolinate reductase [Lentibacillus sp. JNUCC-1]MUV39792.1 4-hydroxy-tetrahydrodipicolinate reductase [Lentibacillus sp. JNUCC-1]
MKSIRIVLAGPRGKMGGIVQQMIKQTEGFDLVGCIDRKSGNPDLQAPVFDNAYTCFEQIEADVLVDFTVADACFEHCRAAIAQHVRPVVGTSGMTEKQMNELVQLTQTHKTGCIIAPNFSTGAVLMMQFAKMAAKLFPETEIIEKHHNQKVDAPSGTAIKTAEMLERDHANKTIPIHSIRLPGLMAHHEVIFGGEGETLSIKHDSYSRDSFMEGIKWAVHHVMTMDHFIYGLEEMLEN